MGLPDWSQATPDGTFGNRWDGHEGTYRVLYASLSHFGAFLETLARFRPDLAVVAELGEIEGDGDPIPANTVPADWFARRLMGSAELTGVYADISAAAKRQDALSYRCGFCEMHRAMCRKSGLHPNASEWRRSGDLGVKSSHDDRRP